MTVTKISDAKSRSCHLSPDQGLSSPDLPSHRWIVIPEIFQQYLTQTKWQKFASTRSFKWIFSSHPRTASPCFSTFHPRFLEKIGRTKLLLIQVSAQQRSSFHCWPLGVRSPLQLVMGSLTTVKPGGKLGKNGELSPTKTGIGWEKWGVVTNKINKNI